MTQLLTLLIGMALGAAVVIFSWACVRLRERDALRADAARRWRTSL